MKYDGMIFTGKVKTNSWKFMLVKIKVNKHYNTTNNAQLASEQK